METCKKILLLRIDRLGDFILSIPFFQRLKERFPHAHIDIIVHENNKLLAQRLGIFHTVLTFNSHRFVTFANTRTIVALLSHHYDLAIDLIPGTQHTSSLLLFLSRAHQKAGYAVGLRKFFLTTKTKAATMTYESDLVLVILETILKEPVMKTRKKDFLLLKNLVDPTALQQVTNNYHLHPENFVVLIHPGLGDKDPRRYWPPTSYAHLIKKIHDQKPEAKIIITGQKQDQHIVKTIQAHNKTTPILDLVGKTTLSQLISLIARANIIICPLTGVTHLAAALQKPTLTLVGPTPIKRWTSPELPYIIATKNLSCSPCEHLSACIHTGTNNYLACMRTLSATNAFEKIKHLITTQKKQ